MSHLGHTLVGALSCELILSILALREQIIPACANSTREELEFPQLNLNTTSRAGKIVATLNTSLGFGGANTCIILARAPRATPHSQKPAQREVFITGVGLLFPGILGLEALAEYISSSHVPTWS